MRLEIEPKDRQFLQRLHRIGGGTIQELCDDLGVTATAIRQRLVRLQGMGLISREAVREGRGRPYYVYGLTATGLKVLGENYAELALTLWRAIKRIDSPEVRTVVLQHVREEMVRRLGRAVQSESVADRVSELSNGLQEQGFDVEVDTTGSLPVLRENNCPYLELAHVDPEICSLEQEVFGEVVGAEIQLSQCCLEGSNCCEFELTPEGSEHFAE